MTNADRTQRLDLNKISEMTGYEKVLTLNITVQYWRREGNEREQADALNDLGMYHFYEFRNVEAKAYLTESCALAEKLGNADLLAKGLVNLGLVHRYRRSQQDAVQCYLRAWEIAIREPMPEVVVSATTNIMIFMDEEVYEGINSDALTAIESGALHHGEPVLAANIARVHGEMLLRTGRREEADTVLRRAAVHSSVNDDWRCFAEIREMRKASRPLFQDRLRAKANDYLASGHVPLAVGVFARIVASFDERDNNPSDYMVWLSIGIDCLKAGLWQPACDHLARLYEVAARNNDASMTAEALRFLSEAQMRLKDLESAQRSLSEAIRIWTTEGSLIGEAVARFKMGRVLLEAGKPDEARRQAERCRECLEQDDSEEAAGVWETLLTQEL